MFYIRGITKSTLAHHAGRDALWALSELRGQTPVRLQRQARMVAPLLASSRFAGLLQDDVRVGMESYVVGLDSPTYAISEISEYP